MFWASMIAEAVVCKSQIPCLFARLWNGSYLYGTKGVN